MTTTLDKDNVDLSLLRAFNTGRRYAPEGQRIAYVPVALDRVPAFSPFVFIALYDVDRGIRDVYLAGINPDHATPGARSVMFAYDNGMVSEDRTIERCWPEWIHTSPFVNAAKTGTPLRPPRPYDVPDDVWDRLRAEAVAQRPWPSHQPAVF